MADYNTFAVIDCKSRKNVLVTSSARLAYARLKTGYRIDVWNNNSMKCSIYAKNRREMCEYIEAERLYHQQKQSRKEHYRRLKQQQQIMR